MEEIEIEYKGKIYKGRRKITRREKIAGKPKVFQTIYYRDFSQFDGHPYNPGEVDLMIEISKVILRELVEKNMGK